jgi:hypothetical protein
MRKNLLVTFISLLVFIGSSAFILKSSGGIVGVTGSPGEGTCAGCHSGGAGSTSVSVSASPAFTLNQYVPGQTYTLTITVSNAAFTRWGFDCEILTSTNTNAGTMTTALSGVKFLNSGARKNATQTTPLVSAGSGNFSFTWVAPVSGNATIYATGNAVNGNGSTSGDAPGQTSLALTAASTAGVNEMVASGFSGINIFPNPVISEIKLRYNLIESGHVKVNLVDLQGKEVLLLNSEHQPAGAHSLSTEIPLGLPKGIYFVQLSLDQKQVTRRLIILQ